MVGEYFFFLVPFAIALFDLGIVAGVVDRVSPIQKIVLASNTLAAIDFRTTGGYPLIWLGNFLNHPTAELSLAAYNLLGPLLSAFFIYAIFLRQSLLRKFLLFFFIASMIAIPLWFVVPALSPYNFYTGGISSHEMPASVAAQFSVYHPSPIVATAIDSAERHQVIVGSNDVTNFPSMHAAWGAGVVYFGIAALGVGAVYALVPWFLFEMAGALINGEHYLIDLVMGILVACVSLWITDRLLEMEKRYYRGKTSFAILVMMHEDAERLIHVGKVICRWVWHFLCSIA